MEIPTPRVTGHHLAQHLGRSVVLMCDVSRGQQAGSNLFAVKSADGADVLIALPPGESLNGCTYVQVEGKVAKPNMLEVQRLQPVGGPFDVTQYNAAMALATGQYSHLFV